MVFLQGINLRGKKFYEKLIANCGASFEPVLFLIKVPFHVTGCKKISYFCSEYNFESKSRIL